MAAAPFVNDRSQKNMLKNPDRRLMPRWDAQRRTLFLGEVVVKAFRQPAPVQETILAAFEEEGWPEHIDDPLPPLPGLSPKDRLNHAIRNLNRAMNDQIIRFRGDGRGTGLFWTKMPGDSSSST